MARLERSGWTVNAVLMWPPESSKVEYKLLGECLSCGRDLTGVMPRVPVANPADLGDLEIVILWRFWTQTHYAVSGMEPEPWSMEEFCHWLQIGSIELPQAVEMKEWEGQLVADFRKRHEGVVDSGLTVARRPPTADRP